MKYLIFIIFFVSFGCIGQDIDLLYSHDSWEAPDFKDIEETSDGGFVICFDIRVAYPSPFIAGIMKIDNTGAIEWTHLLEIPDSEASYSGDVSVKSNGDFYLTGMTVSNTTNLTKSYLCEITSTGTLSWYREYTESSSLTGEYSDNQIEILPSGELYLLATHSTLSTLMKLNSDGTIIWGKTIVACEFNCPSQNANQIMKLVDDGSVIRTNFVNDAQAFIKYDVNRTVIWSRYFDYDYFMRIFDFTLASDGFLYGAGTSFDTIDYQTDIFFLKLNPVTGDPVWSKKITDSNFAGISDATIMEDGSGLFCNVNLVNVVPGYSVEYLMRMTYDGQVTEAVKNKQAWFPGVYNISKKTSDNNYLIAGYGGTVVTNYLGLLHKTDNPFSSCAFSWTSLAAEVDTTMTEVSNILLESNFNSSVLNSTTLVSISFNTIGLCENVGLQNHVSDDSISLFPNPSSERMTLNVPEVLVGATYSIFDSKGKLYLTGAIYNSSQVVEVSDLTKGVYYIRFNSDYTTKSIRFIVF